MGIVWSWLHDNNTNDCSPIQDPNTSKASLDRPGHALMDRDVKAGHEERPDMLIREGQATKISTRQQLSSMWVKGALSKEGRPRGYVRPSCCNPLQHPRDPSTSGWSEEHPYRLIFLSAVQAARFWMVVRDLQPSNLMSWRLGHTVKDSKHLFHDRGLTSRMCRLAGAPSNDMCLAPPLIMTWFRWGNTPHICWISSPSWHTASYMSRQVHKQDYYKHCTGVGCTGLCMPVFLSMHFHTNVSLERLINQ